MRQAGNEGATEASGFERTDLAVEVRLGLAAGILDEVEIDFGRGGRAAVRGLGDGFRDSGDTIPNSRPRRGVGRWRLARLAGVVGPGYPHYVRQRGDRREQLSVNSGDTILNSRIGYGVPGIPRNS